MKKEFDDFTIEVIDYLVLVTYKKHFSETTLYKAKEMLKIAFPLFEIHFIKEEEEKYD